MLKKLLNFRSNKKALAGLYRYCEIEYGSSASYMFNKLRDEYDV